MRDFEHQVINELLSGGVAGHRRLAHLRTTRRDHLTIHQRHLGNKCNVVVVVIVDSGIVSYIDNILFKALQGLNLLFCEGPRCSFAALED